MCLLGKLKQIENYEGSARAMYAVDSSARKAADTVEELKEKTERMLMKLFQVTRENILAQNTSTDAKNKPKES